MSLETARIKLKENEIEKVRSKWKSAGRVGATKKTRDEIVAERLRAGEKDYAIAASLDVCRERVRQLYSRHVKTTNEKITNTHRDLLSLTTDPKGRAFLNSYETFAKKMDELCQ